MNDGLTDRRTDGRNFRDEGQNSRVGALGMRLLVLALSVGPSVRPSVATAQDPIRAHVMGDPLPGRDAPAFSLPYVTAAGPGPVGQPFVLRAELGRVVVLAFVPGFTDSASVALVRGLESDSLWSGDVVGATLVPLGVGRLGSVVKDRGISLKALADSSEGVRRLYGVERGSIAVYVVNPLGKVAWRSLNVNPFSRSTYNSIRNEVSKAGRGS